MTKIWMIILLLFFLISISFIIGFSIGFDSGYIARDRMDWEGCGLIYNQISGNYEYDVRNININWSLLNETNQS